MSLYTCEYLSFALLWILLSLTWLVSLSVSKLAGVNCLIRELLHTKKRQQDTYDHLKEVTGNALINCDIEMIGPEATACSQGPSFLPHEITDGMLNLEMLDEQQSGYLPPDSVSITMDNLLSPGHTLVQIVCQDHKGLLYDIMRTLKDYNIQV